MIEFIAPGTSTTTSSPYLPYLHPRHIFAIPEIPLAQTNKVGRARLKAEAAALSGRYRQQRGMRFET